MIDRYETIRRERWGKLAGIDDVGDTEGSTGPSWGDKKQGGEADRCNQSEDQGQIEGARGANARLDFGQLPGCDYLVAIIKSSPVEDTLECTQQVLFIVKVRLVQGGNTNTDGGMHAAAGDWDARASYRIAQLLSKGHGIGERVARRHYQELLGVVAADVIVSAHGSCQALGHFRYNGLRLRLPVLPADFLKLVDTDQHYAELAIFAGGSGQFSSQ